MREIVIKISDGRFIEVTQDGDVVDLYVEDGPSFSTRVELARESAVKLAIALLEATQDPEPTSAPLDASGAMYGTWEQHGYPQRFTWYGTDAVKPDEIARAHVTQVVRCDSVINRAHSRMMFYSEPGTVFPTSAEPFRSVGRDVEFWAILDF